MKHRPLGYIIAVISVVVLAVIGLNLCLGYMRRVDQQQAAQEIVAEALIAVRENDIEQIKTLLYSDSIDLRWLSDYSTQMPKILHRLSRLYDLGSLTDSEIRASVHAVPNVRRELVISIVQKSRDRNYPAKWPTWQQDTPIVVRYVIKEVPMVTVALREKGKWKIAGLPLTFSANILQYESVDDATLHGDALAEPGETK